MEPQASASHKSTPSHKSVPSGVSTKSSRPSALTESSVGSSAFGAECKSTGLTSLCLASRFVKKTQGRVRRKSITAYKEGVTSRETAARLFWPAQRQDWVEKEDGRIVNSCAESTSNTLVAVLGQCREPLWCSGSLPRRFTAAPTAHA